MVSLSIGEILQSTITGRIYRVRTINGQIVVLESTNGLSHVLTQKENIDLFYITVYNKKTHSSDSGGNGSL